MIELIRKVGKRCDPANPPQSGDLVIGKYKGDSCDGHVYRVVDVPYWDRDSVQVVRITNKDGSPAPYTDNPVYADGTRRYTHTMKMRKCCHYEMGAIQL